MEYHWIESEEEFLKHEESWRNLIEKNPANTMFQSWDWMSNWQKHFGASGDLKILVALDERDAFHAIAAFQVKRRKLFGRTVFREWLFLGADSIACSDHLDFITEDAVDSDIVVELLDRVWSRLAQFDALTLSDMPRDSSTIETVTTWAKKNRVWQHSISGEVCPAMPLPDTWEKFLDGLSANFRSQIRRSRRKIQKDKKLNIRQIEDDKHIYRIVDKIFLLSEWRHKEKGVNTTLKTDEMQSFLRDLIPQCLKRECAWLYAVEEEGDIVAAVFCMINNKTVSYYQAAFDPRISGYRPGTVLISMIIERAIERRYRTFDFLRGEEVYKYRWKAEPVKSISLSLVRADFIGMTLRWVYKQIKRGTRWLTK